MQYGYADQISQFVWDTTNTSAVYWNVDLYETSFDENNKFKGFSFSRSAGDNWYNINLSDTEIDEIKQKYSDWLSDGASEKELAISGKADKFISEETKPLETQKTLLQLTKEEELLVGSWEGEMVVSDGTFITDEDYASAGSTMTIAKMCNVKITDDRSGLLYFGGEYSSFGWEYDTTEDGQIVYSVKMGKGDTILVYSTDPNLEVFYKKLILYIEDDSILVFTKP